MKTQTRILDNRLYYTKKIKLHCKGKKSRTVRITLIAICPSGSKISVLIMVRRVHYSKMGKFPTTEMWSFFTMTVSPTLRSLGFTYTFLSVYWFIVLLALVSCSLMIGSSAMGMIRCGRWFFMVQSNRIEAGVTPVVQCGVVR